MEHDHDEAHDRGLAFDLGTMDRLHRALTPAVLDRRGALKVLGGFSLLALAGCGAESSRLAQGGTTSSAGGASPTAAAGASGGSCTTIPRATAGPFPGDGSNGPNVLNQSGVVRRDITSSFGSSTTKATGVPLTILLAIQRKAGGCAAYRGVAVYLWHCDQAARYSLYDPGVTEESYLRGVQEAGSDGKVTFQSIYPAAYAGRYPHIHFEVFESLARAAVSGSRLISSQLALPEAANKLVYATPGYEMSVTNLARTPLSRDGIFGGDAAAQTPRFSGDAASGFTIELEVPV